MKKIQFVILFLWILIFVCPAYSQVHSFDVGLRFQKTVGLYYENGLTGQYSLTKRWVVGAAYSTSRLGTAWGTNAIGQDNFLLSGAYLFQPERSLQPFIRANLGYFSADYGSEIFNSLMHTSAIASADAGLGYAFKFPVKMNLSIGYNAITGNGTSGAGTLYPVFYQASILYHLPKHLSK